MAEFFPFKTEHTLIAHDNIIWSDADTNVDKSGMGHFAASDAECYTTPDGAEFLSVLEQANEIPFDQLHNLPMDNEEAAQGLESTESDDLSNQVLVFKMDGSDDLYGIQVVQGEDGRVEKYQFKFGQNENGELEPIPETIQLLPNDEIEKEKEMELHPGNIKEEMFTSDDAMLDHNAEGHIISTQEEENYENAVEPEEDIPDYHHRIHIKEELMEEEPINNEERYEYSEENSTEISEELDQLSAEADHNNTEPTYQEYDEIYIENHHDETQCEMIPNNPMALDENYQLIDSLPITADSGHHVELQQPETILQRTLEQSNNGNILKQLVPKLNTEEGSDKVMYYILHTVPQEKENVNNSLYKPIKTNPRSLLKTSFSPPTPEVEYDERFEKRFAKSKEAIQSRLFQNFITKTTIPQAPVRNVRLPRKQQIKPVNDRMDEEIIVQEVMVSSNGSIVSIDKNRRNQLTIVTDIVELTDSEDEQSEIDEAANIIEIFNSDDDVEVEQTPKKRGRPRKSLKTPKNVKKELEDKSTETEAEAKCPCCPKTFPNQNSLNTHIQHHNLENSIAKSKNFNKYTCDKCGEGFKNIFLKNKHVCTKQINLQCPICKLRFRDVTRLNMHKRMHLKDNMAKSSISDKVSPAKSPRNANNKSFKCIHCPKMFQTSQLLSAHETIHRRFKCANCPKSFTSKIVLDSHIRDSCVKSKAPNKRLSLKTKRRTSIIGKPKPCTPVRALNLSCEQCAAKFTTHRDLFKHKVQKHGLDTPDKSVLQATRAARTASHSGVPVNERLRRAYAGFRAKLEHSQGPQ